MPSKLDLKIYKGKLIGFNPNLNNNIFPTTKQVDQIFHNHKNSLSQVFRIEIENPDTLTQTTFVMKHAKARGIATDHDVKEIHCGAMVQIQGYYNTTNDLHTAIGIQAISKHHTLQSSTSSNNPSAEAISQFFKTSKADSKVNSSITSLVRSKASASIAQQTNKQIVSSQSSHSDKFQVKKFSNTTKKDKKCLQNNNVSISNNTSSISNETQSISSTSHIQKSNQINKDIKNSSINNSVKASNNPNYVVESAMKQVTTAGYHVPSFNNISNSTSTANLSTLDNNSNNISTSQTISKSAQSVGMNSKSLKSIYTNSNVSGNKTAFTSDVKPSNFLPKDKSESNSNKNINIDSKTNKPLETQSNAISNIAKKYHVTTSMATIKYKLMKHQSNVTKSVENRQKKDNTSEINNNSASFTSNSATISTKSNDASSRVPKSNNGKKVQELHQKQQYYKNISNKDTNTLKQLQILQRKSNKNDKDIPTTKEITQKIQNNKLPTEHLNKHGKAIQRAYREVMDSKHMSTEQLEDKLRDIYRLEGWNDFFKQDTQSFMTQLKNDVNRIFKGKDVTYPLSYNQIPDINNFEKLIKLQEKQHNLNRKGNK